MLTLLLIGALGLVFDVGFVGAGGTIYIRADGSVEGTNKIQRDGDVYTFTGNIFDEIVVERSNIIIDGDGYTLQGSGSGIGFYWYDINNVTIQNTIIKNFFWGVYLDSSSFNTISVNTIRNNFEGISLYESSNNSICGNDIMNNDVDGISLWDSSNDNNIYGNHITDNEDGIWLISSSNNSIYRNDITANKLDGIWLASSSNNSIHENHITANKEYGILLFESSNNTIYHNNLIDNMVQANVTSGYVNTWDNGCEGNYWSNYTGTDADGDGIGDDSHPIDAFNQDNYPLMSPYMVGDINHDGTVDINDLATLDEAYGSQPGDSNWNCHCDITGPVENPERSGLYPPDEVVDVYDLATVGKSY